MCKRGWAGQLQVRVDNLGAKEGWDKLEAGATLSMAMSWSDSDVWAVLCELRQEFSSLREKVMLGHVNSHAEDRSARCDWTFEEWGNDRADYGTKMEYVRVRGELPVRELRAWLSEECRWVHVRGEMVTGEVRAKLRKEASSERWIDYIQDKETMNLSEVVVCDEWHWEGYQQGLRCLEKSITARATRCKVWFGWCNTGNRSRKWGWQDGRADQRVDWGVWKERKEAGRCVICDQGGEEDMTHVALECTGAGMVEARKRWLEDLSLELDKYPIRKLGGWINRQTYGHNLQVRFESVEERLFWRGLLKREHTVGMSVGEVGGVVRRIVDGYVMLWKLRCGVMGKVKVEARNKELKERRELLVVSGYEERKVRHWGLSKLRVKSMEILADC